jgi:putative phosphoesterase
MRIGVLSDTHDRLSSMDAALKLFEQRRVEAVIHPGDLVAPFAAKQLLTWSGPLYVIYGNNDGERQGLKAILPMIQDGPLWVEAGDKRVLVHHFIEWCQPEHIEEADIVITGHTHEVVNEQRDGKLFLNPGECCGWVNGRCTAAILETDALSAEIIEVMS